MRMRPFGKLLPLEAALRRTLAATRPVAGFESVPLTLALGRVLEETVRAAQPHPAFPRATWDGFAVRAVDTRGASRAAPVPLDVVGEVFAEGRLARPLARGEAAAIATGGAMPHGADAVVIFEDSGAEGSKIRVRRPVPAGERVARPGSDFPKGSVLARKGALLDAATLGALGATGRATVRVRRRPIVTLLPNGNELRPLGAPLARGAIYEINNLTLGALARASGAEVRSMPPVADDPALLEAAIRTAERSSDLVLVTGGSSVGEHDFLPVLFPRVGRLLYHGVAVRPGKPTLAARGPNALLLGMPGHPTSCLSNGFWLLLPVLSRLAGGNAPAWVPGSATLARAVAPPSPTMTTVVSLHVENGRATPTFRDSSAITSLAGANAYALLPPGARRPRVGAPIAFRRLLPPIAPA